MGDNFRSVASLLILGPNHFNFSFPLIYIQLTYYRLREIRWTDSKNV